MVKNKTIQSLLFTVFLIGKGIFTPSPIFAQAIPPTASDSLITNPMLSDSIRKLSGVNFTSSLLSSLITLFFVIAAVLAAIYFLINAIRMITAGGNKDQFAQGRQGITMALTGLIVIFLLYAVLKLIGYLFDLDLITIDISPLLLR